jgi:23S rRNA (uridine2552-2'-O)-methyltransferase
MVHPSVKDPYRARAKEEGFPARSVYKLKAIQDKYRLVRPGQRVVDLGSHPGSWLKFCSHLVGPEGRVLGLDLKRPTIPLPSNALFIQADLASVGREAFGDWIGQTDVVLSDVAPQTSGVKWLDQQRSLDLNRQALRVATFLLKKGGDLVLKIFEGPDLKEFSRELGRHFEGVRLHKPKSSRSGSPEIFLVARGFKGRPEENSDGVV